MHFDYIFLPSKKKIKPVEFFLSTVRIIQRSTRKTWTKTFPLQGSKQEELTDLDRTALYLPYYLLILKQNIASVRTSNLLWTRFLFVSKMNLKMQDAIWNCRHKLHYSSKQMQPCMKDKNHCPRVLKIGLMCQVTLWKALLIFSLGFYEGLQIV